MDRFQKEIENAKKFDSVLFNLKDKDLHNFFLKRKYEIQNIKCRNCWRHNVFYNNHCDEFPNRCKDNLHYHVEFGGYTDNQLTLLLKWVLDFSEDILYNFLVLLPETLIILTQEIFGVSQEDASTYIIDGGENLEVKKKRLVKWLGIIEAIETVDGGRYIFKITNST